MKILNLWLENFQGIRSLELSFGGKDAAIYGANATGKTTVANAVSWLLCGSDAAGTKNYDPKTKDSNGDRHNLEHGVSARIQTETRIITLRKVFREVYRKKRGSADTEFTGNTIDYYVDSVPKKEKDYIEDVERILGCNADLVRILSTPSHFPERIDWQKRRELLLQLCGEISDTEVMESSPKLKSLPQFLQIPGVLDRFYTVEEYRKIAGARKTEINKRLDMIPGRIDEAQRAIPDASTADKASIKAQLEDLTASMDRLRQRRAEILAGSGEATRTKAADLKARLSEAKLQYASKESKKNESLYQEIQAAKKELVSCEDSINKAQSELDRNKKKLAEMKVLRADLMKQYTQVRAEDWDDANSVCPTCHRPLPEEEVQKLKEGFNIRKSQRLADINQRGKEQASKEAITALEATLDRDCLIILDGKKKAEKVRARIFELDNQLGEIPPFELTAEYADFKKELERIEQEKVNAEDDVSALLEPVDDELNGLQLDANNLSASLAKIQMTEDQHKRIAELEAEEKALAAEFEDAEQGIYLCEQFVRAKVSMLTERINNRFENVRFQLFQEQINGGLKECCEVLIPSPAGAMVPFSMANNAARINAGLEIISVLSEHYGVELPIFVDNAESISKLYATTAQVVRLVVSESDTELRMECETDE